jgi:hypothetical protein
MPSRVQPPWRLAVKNELLANGRSVATNSTPDSMRVATKPGYASADPASHDQRRASSFCDHAVTRQTDDTSRNDLATLLVSGKHLERDAGFLKSL